jgi:hypothetical protein
MSETNPIVAALQVAFESAVEATVERRLAPLSTRLAALEARPAVGQLELGHLETIADYVSLSELINYVSMSELAGAVNLPALAAELSLSDLAGELVPSQLEEVAEHVNLSALADEISVERIAEHVNIESKVRDYFEDNTFRFREA